MIMWEAMVASGDNGSVAGERGCDDPPAGWSYLRYGSSRVRKGEKKESRRH